MELKMLTGKFELLLEGDLVGYDPHLWYHIHRIASLHPELLIVDASRARINPEGVSFWIKMVHETLSKTPIKYRDSQLAHVLRYSDEYKHFNTVLPEY